MALGTIATQQAKGTCNTMEAMMQLLSYCDNFWTKTKQTMSLQHKGTKRGGPGTGVGAGETKRNAQRNGISGPPEGSWRTKFHRDVLSLRACTGAPGSGATTWLLFYWRDDCSAENLLLWVINKLKLKMNQSGLKASLEARILGIFE